MNNVRSERKDIIRVLVVEDSPSASKALTEILNSDAKIIVAGVAGNGKEAVERTPLLKPDIITMDMDMPVMDGLEATKQIMAYSPTPILIVCASVVKIKMETVFKAISYGALDVIDKGQIGASSQADYGAALIEKIKFLSRIKVISHPLAKLDRGRVEMPPSVPKEEALGKIVAIVTSTGGPAALLAILKSLPKEFPCGIVIVQHITSGFLEGLAEWLNNECRIKVKVAEDTEGVHPGVAYLAPTNLQMRLKDDGKICLSDEPPHNGHRPSGDVLLESVSRAYKDKAIGVILTGMGRDGAKGIYALRQENSRTIAQDEKSCVVFGMPKAAIEMDAVDRVLPLGEIAGEIVKMLEKR